MMNSRFIGMVLVAALFSSGAAFAGEIRVGTADDLQAIITWCEDTIPLHETGLVVDCRCRNGKHAVAFTLSKARPELTVKRRLTAFAVNHGGCVGEPRIRRVEASHARLMESIPKTLAEIEEKKRIRVAEQEWANRYWALRQKQEHMRHVQRLKAEAEQLNIHAEQSNQDAELAARRETAASIRYGLERVRRGILGQ